VQRRGRRELLVLGRERLRGELLLMGRKDEMLIVVGKDRALLGRRVGGRCPVVGW